MYCYLTYVYWMEKLRPMGQRFLKLSPMGQRFLTKSMI